MLQKLSFANLRQWTPLHAAGLSMHLICSSSGMMPVSSSSSSKGRNVLDGGFPSAALSEEPAAAADEPGRGGGNSSSSCSSLTCTIAVYSSLWKYRIPCELISGLC